MRPVVVFDTNVLISGMIWGGVPYECIALAQHGNVEGITCEEILDEFVDKLTTKFGFSLHRASEIVTELLDFLHIVEITNQLKGITTDPDDNIVIECAVVGGATHIITGDQKHLLPLESYQGILIVKPADFLTQFQ
ncbi:MAG: putative toxin-antitoxin system toxin component, PIN family [Candidatus Poribacteria bacterium]|nr:putative toxin-antitoxin system toxin component, PIN family [Candidatus Poribacteria bacterium]